MLVVCNNDENVNYLVFMNFEIILYICKWFKMIGAPSFHSYSTNPLWSIIDEWRIQVNLVSRKSLNLETVIMND